MVSFQEYKISNLDIHIKKILFETTSKLPDRNSILSPSFKVAQSSANFQKKRIYNVILFLLVLLCRQIRHVTELLPRDQASYDHVPLIYTSNLVMAMKITWYILLLQKYIVSELNRFLIIEEQFNNNKNNFEQYDKKTYPDMLLISLLTKSQYIHSFFSLSLRSYIL